VSNLYLSLCAPSKSAYRQLSKTSSVRFRTAHRAHSVMVTIVRQLRGFVNMGRDCRISIQGQEVDKSLGIPGELGAKPLRRETLRG
jgi:hypothetical protein